tara:strand:- start:8 stop:862 length:855 start_codon:yes stop_codon:yes gene_type:complete
MIEKIYIPTVKRVGNQITYNCLSDSLKKRVVFVVQSWEREQYKYDAEYLVLPEWLTYKHPHAIAETRSIIYQHAKTSKYMMADDDMVIVRRNEKYLGLPSNMEKAKRIATPDDVDYLFENASKILTDNDDACYLGVAAESFAPKPETITKLQAIYQIWFIDGNKLYDTFCRNQRLLASTMHTSDDTLFNIVMATNGKAGWKMNDFCSRNKSIDKKANIGSVLWDNNKEDQSQQDQRLLAKMYPKYYKIKDDATLAYRGLVLKARFEYKKAYNDAHASKLDYFLS